MISKLPRWIEYGAFTLALGAGCINAIGLLGFDHQSVSHLSGTATLIGAGLLSNSALVSLHLIGVLFSFFMGAAVAGFMLHGSTLMLGRHYDTALLFEVVLLLLALILLSNGSSFGHYAASAACGLQNALATTYSGAIIRTTHLTGIFTDLGIMLGSILRGEPFDRRKALLFFLIITGFILGGSVGAALYTHYEFRSLLFPASLCLALAITYRMYSKQH